MTLDAGNCLENGGLSQFAADKLVIGPRLHAMPGSQQKVASDCGCSARRPRGTENHDDRASEISGRGRRTADHRTPALRNCEDGESGRRDDDENGESAATPPDSV